MGGDGGVVVDDRALKFHPGVGLKRRAGGAHTQPKIAGEAAATAIPPECDGTVEAGRMQRKERRDERKHLRNVAQRLDHLGNFSRLWCMRGVGACEPRKQFERCVEVMDAQEEGTQRQGDRKMKQEAAVGGRQRAPARPAPTPARQWVGRHPRVPNLAR